MSKKVSHLYVLGIILILSTLVFVNSASFGTNDKGTSSFGFNKINPDITNIFSNALGNCTAGQFILGFDTNGFKYCSSPGALVETDPWWSANYTLYNTSWSLDTNCNSTGACSVGNVAYMNYSNIGNLTGNGSAGNSWLKNWTGFIGRAGSMTFRLGGASQTFFFQDISANNIFAITSTGVVFYSDATPLVDNAQSLGAFDKNFATIYSYRYGNDTASYSLGELARDNDSWVANYSLYYNTTQIDSMNTSNNNFILFTNTTMKSYVDALNTAFNNSNNNYIAQNNNSVNNYILQNNNSVNNYILANNNSVNNYILFTNTSMKSYVDANFIKNQTPVNFTTANATNFYTNSYGGNCPLTNGSWCRNSSGTYIIG